jgi:MFS family permease
MIAQKPYTKKSKIFTKNLLILFFIQMAIFSSLSLTGSIFPYWLSNQFNISPYKVGLILGLVGVSMILSRPFMGYLVDKFGRKNMLIISLFLFALTNFLYIRVNNINAVLVIRFFQGIPFTLSTTAISTLASDLIPEDRRGEGLSYFSISSTVSLGIGPSIGFAFYAISWMRPFITSIAICFLSLFISFLIREPDQLKVNAYKYSMKSIFEKRILIISLVGAISFMAMPSIFSFIAFYAKELNIYLSNIGLIFSFYAVGLLLIRLFGARIIEKKSPAFSGSLSIILLAIGLLVISLSRSLVSLLIGSLIVGAGSGTILPTLLTMALNIAPEKKGICNALIFGGLDLANSAGLLLFGAIVGKTDDYSFTYLVFAFFEIIALMIFLFITIPYYKRSKSELSLIGEPVEG